VTAARTIAGYAMREAMRRRVFAVVLVLSVLSGGLYVLGAVQAFDLVSPGERGAFGIDEHEIVGSTVFGLAMFVTLFLGAVLAIFLTHGVVRGDAERGLLQPLVVRPVGRGELFLARLAGAAAVSAAYVAVVFLLAVAAIAAIGDWTPDRIVEPLLELSLAVVIVCALSLLGSVFLSATANGIAMFMVYGAGLTAGLLGQIGDALDSDTLEQIARAVSWAVPFEALYQDALAGLAADASGFTDQVVELGPFGGAQSSGPLLWAWSVAYVAAIAVVGVRCFARRDL
jgi:hypothetical protein